MKVECSADLNWFGSKMGLFLSYCAGSGSMTVLLDGLVHCLRSFEFGLVLSGSWSSSYCSHFCCLG